MTVTELARLLATQISQGRGGHQVALFQWQHGWEALTEVVPRDGADVLELYSNTGGAPAPAEEDDDLLGIPADDDFDDLI